MRVHAKPHEHGTVTNIFHGGWCRLIVVCTSFLSDELSHVGCIAQHPRVEIMLGQYRSRQPTSFGGRKSSNGRTKYLFRRKVRWKIFSCRFDGFEDAHGIFYVYKINLSGKRANECGHLERRNRPRLIVEYSILYFFKIMMASDQFGHYGCTARRPGGGIVLGFRILGRSLCTIRRLIVVFFSRMQQWIMTGVSILAVLHCLVVKNDYLFRFVHKIVGAWSSARPQGQLKPGKLWKVFFTPGFCATYVDLW